MNMVGVPRSDTPELDALINQTVSGVAFVRNYFQLEFDEAGLTINVWPTLVRNGVSLRQEMPGYADGLISLIGKSIERVALTADGLVVAFVSGEILDIPMGDVPETAVLNLMIEGKPRTVVVSGDRLL